MSPREIWVDARTTDGAEAVAFTLAHGADPNRVLARHGYAGKVTAAALQPARPDRLVLSFTVEATGAAPEPDPAVPTDDGLVLAPGERPHLHQRTAAYALVTSGRGLLLAQFSDQTNAEGSWGLPGGGVDPREEPVAALHREIHEESGQRVDEPELVGVRTRHWVGRAPGGRLEDFHAVRILYRAGCPDPTDPVVHEVGGSTAAARWFGPEDLSGLPVTASWAGLVEDWRAARR